MRIQTILLLLILTTAWVDPVASQGLPPTRDVAYIGTVALNVDATDLAHKVLLVRETLPVRPGPLTLIYPL